MKDFQLTDNSNNNQFEFNIDGYIAKIEYLRVDEKDIYLMHTEVPKELAGVGIATQLVEKMLEYIEINGLHMIPVCPFIVDYVKRHPEWTRLVKKGVKILNS